MARKRIITLLTDFGTADGYVGCIKGVLAGATDAQVVDISHHVPRGDVLAGAFVLNQVLDYFPPGTVHLAVVDPGVGTERRVLAARYAGQFIVAPDNGLVSMVDARLPLEEIVSVRNQDLFLPRRLGATFEGRDIMAPVAAAIANGLALHRLGPTPDKYHLLNLPQPTWDGAILTGQVLYIDVFGNCITNISQANLEQRLPRAMAVEVSAKDAAVGPLLRTYALAPAGKPLALLNSLGLLEIAVNAGRACDVLRLAAGDPVTVRYGEPSAGGPVRRLTP